MKTENKIGLIISGLSFIMSIIMIFEIPELINTFIIINFISYLVFMSIIAENINKNQARDKK